MKKRCLRVVLFLAMIMTIMITAKPVEAATKSITAGTWTRCTVEGTYYKFSVTKEGYVTLYAKSPNGSNSIGVELLDSKKRAVIGTKGQIQVEGFGNTKSIKIAVSPGTYYIHALDVYGSQAYTMYKFTAVTQTNNFSIPKAASWSQNAYKNICITQNYGFDHWYKIKLTQKQALTFTYAAFDPDWGYPEIYTANGTKKSISYSQKVTTSSVTLKTKTSLAAGTYYVCIEAPYSIYQTHFYKAKWN